MFKLVRFLHKKIMEVLTKFQEKKMDSYFDVVITKTPNADLYIDSFGPNIRFIFPNLWIPEVSSFIRHKEDLVYFCQDGSHIFFKKFFTPGFYKTHKFVVNGEEQYAVLYLKLD